MTLEKDPLLAALARIEAKQDLTLEQQSRMESEIDEIRRDTRRVAAITGGAAGGLVSTGILLIKAKFGL